MGLGKTFQTIAFISRLQEEGVNGPHLMVVPLSVLFNWIAEMRKFAPKLRVLRVHSNSAMECKELRMKLSTDDHRYDVYVTTYEIVKSDQLGNALNQVQWRSIVLDEGHRIKNVDSLVSKACKNLKARFKLILTGTPVQNNLHETYCLLK